MHESPLHRVLRAALRGGVVGLGLSTWASAWVVGFLLLWESNHLTLGVAILDRFRHLTAIPAEKVLRAVGENLSLPIPSHPLSFAAAVIGVGVVVGAALGVLSWLVALDRGSLGLESFWWGLRGCLSPPTVFIILLPPVAGFIASAWDNWLAFAITIITGLSFLLAYLVVPFAMCRSAVVSGSRPGRWWRPRWPGRARFLRLVALGGALLVATLAQHLISALPPGLTAVVGVPVSALALLVPLLFALILIADPPLRPGAVRQILRWRVVGPWISFHLWLLAAWLAVLVPAAVLYVWSWKVVPVVASIAEAQQVTIPIVWRWLVAALRYIDRYLWLAFSFPLACLYWLGVARLAYRLGPVVSSAAGGESPTSQDAFALDRVAVSTDNRGSETGSAGREEES